MILMMECDETMKIDIYHHIATQQKEVFCQFWYLKQSPCCTQRTFLNKIRDVDTKFLAVVKIFLYNMSQMSYDKGDVCQSVCFQVLNLPFEYGLTTYTNHWLWDVVGNRCNACPFTASHDNYFHFSN